MARISDGGGPCTIVASRPVDGVLVQHICVKRGQRAQVFAYLFAALSFVSFMLWRSPKLFVLLNTSCAALLNGVFLYLRDSMRTMHMQIVA